MKTDLELPQFEGLRSAVPFGDDQHALVGAADNERRRSVRGDRRKSEKRREGERRDRSAPARVPHAQRAVGAAGHTVLRVREAGNRRNWPLMVSMKNASFDL